MKRVPYIVVVGEKEMSEGAVAVRRQGGQDEGAMPVEKFIGKVQAEVAAQLS